MAPYLLDMRVIRLMTESVKPAVRVDNGFIPKEIVKVLCKINKSRPKCVYFQINICLRLFTIVFLFSFHLADLPSLFSRFFPTREVLIHQCMETGIVAGF